MRETSPDAGSAAAVPAASRAEATATNRVRTALTKVPQITIVFWVLKLLTTGMGEAMSDFLGDHSVPIAGAIGLFGLMLALRLQLRQPEYRAPYYWFAVMMIAVFGTMSADAVHDGASIGYDVTTPAFALITAAVFWFWYRSEGTLSIHTIDSPRRERFYWLAVYCTFALGTAAGDLTATFLNIGFGHSIELFAAIICIPAIGWWRFNMNPIFAFWFAYVITRPLGASFADWFGKPPSISGLNLGDGPVSGVALIVFIALVAWVTVTKYDVQRDSPEPVADVHPHRSVVPQLASERGD
jgi:uncharacterized membrane-anchored protein